MPFVRFAVPFLLWLTTVAVSTAAATSTYESIRALDRSGQAVQLQHAQAAADQQGRLIVALTVQQGDDDDSSNERLVYILTTPRQTSAATPLYQRKESSTNGNAEVVVTNSIARNCPQRIVCSGVQGDARWLLERLRQYAKTVHVRYDTTQGLDVAQTVAALQRAVFWGTDEDAWNHCLGTDDSSWGRPMGVRTLVVDPVEGKLCIVEPSGVIQYKKRVACLGKESEQVQRQLNEVLSKDGPLKVEEVKTAVREVFSSILPSATVVQVEILSPSGEIETQTWSL